MEFFNTAMGRKYYNNDLPELIRSINKLANAIEKSNTLKERSNKFDEKLKALQIKESERK